MGWIVTHFFHSQSFHFWLQNSSQELFQQYSPKKELFQQPYIRIIQVICIQTNMKKRIGFQDFSTCITFHFTYVFFAKEKIVKKVGFQDLLLSFLAIVQWCFTLCMFESWAATHSCNRKVPILGPANTSWILLL